MTQETRIPRKAGHVRPSQLPRGPKGFALCRQCGEEVATSRKTFCNDTCVHAWRLTTNPGYQREHVFARDHGVCAVCRVDTVAQMQRFRERVVAACRAAPANPAPRVVVKSVALLHIYCPDVSAEIKSLSISHHRFVLAYLGRYRGRWTVATPHTTAAWDMDHVVAVVEGGGGCGLENLRTLCLACHAGVTAALRKRRSRPARLSTGKMTVVT